jgi:chloramphenicol 3-O-phosphotransferase
LYSDACPEIFDDPPKPFLRIAVQLRRMMLAGERSAMTITLNYEYPREEAGVWMSFTVKPGPVTLLSITSDQRGFHFVAAKGEALPAKGRLQGHPNALIRLEMPLRSFFSVTTTIGTTQH